MWLPQQADNEDEDKIAQQGHKGRKDRK